MTATHQITSDQYAFLTGGIQPSRVLQLRGQSHVKAWDVRRHLIRVFGFGGFDVESRYETLVKEIEHPPGSIKRTGSNGNVTTNERTLWTVVYRVGLRLAVKDHAGHPIAYYDDAATGDSCNQPSLGDAHDQALKTAHSQALKRCAVNLGDQFGLSLYNGGKADAVVLRSLVAPGVSVPRAVTPEEDVTVEGGEMDEASQDQPQESLAVPVQSQRPSAAAREASPDGGLTPQRAAESLAMLAAKCGDVDKLRGIWAEAQSRELTDLLVTSALTAAERGAAKASDAVTLGQWLTLCGGHVKSTGISVSDGVSCDNEPPMGVGETDVMAGAA